MADGISGRDLDALRGLLALTFDDPGPALPWQLMECMRDLFHSDSMKLCRFQPALAGFVLEQALGETQEVEIGADPPDPTTGSCTGRQPPAPTPTALATSST